MKKFLGIFVHLLMFSLLLATAVAASSANQSQTGHQTEAYLPIMRLPDISDLFGPIHHGEGTYYDADGSGNCSFPPSPENLMVAAMNNSDYNQADYCGAYIQVTGPEGTVVVRIVDRCPECAPGDIDLSLQAFAQIAEVAHGRVPISWQLISYPVEGPIVYQFKDGSNPWWTAVQIRNHRHPISKFEYLSDAGWVELPRQQWNYFLADQGLGDGPFSFRVTDSFGRTLIDHNIPLLDNASAPGSGQFPPP